MLHLKQYVDQKNFWNRLAKRPVMEVDSLTRDQIGYLLDCIECDLSPENLCCDGELRGPALRKKERMLLGAKRKLEGMVA